MHYTKTLFLHVSLSLVLLLTTTAVALANPDVPGGQGKGNGNGNGGGHGRGHGHYKVPHAPVELKGPPTQPQHPIAPPPGATAANVATQDNHTYLPLVAQGEGAQAQSVQAAAVLNLPIDLKLLVISADGKETDYPAITSFLSQIGIPFDTLIASQTPLTAAMLSNGTVHGFYQGIILVTGNLSYFNSTLNQWVSAFDSNEWNTLWNYEAQFGVRQVTSYTYPGGWPDSYGLNLVTFQDTTTTPLNATLTAAGQKIYPYLKATTPVTIKNAWVYLATIVNTAVTTPLLTSGVYAIASINNYPNGRQNLTVTAANNPFLLHSLLLSYGTINWVTKGLFLGERHVYLAPQNDDILIDDDIWNTTALTDTTGLTYRMSGADLTANINGQNTMRRTYPLANTPGSPVTIEWAFNGSGAVAGAYTPDTLTPAVIQNQGQFRWINHTFDHLNLDAITTTLALQELTLNDQAVTNQLHFTNYFKDSMVNPDISGLGNPQFFQAAQQFGIKYLISDSSQPGWNNPSPNAGFFSQFQPGILIIPRHPTNLFYNLQTPTQWVSEYNCYYGPTGTCAGGAWRFWSQNQTYAQILDNESNIMLQYLLKWDIDPLMFHQPNTGRYDIQGHTLMGDLINATLTKYSNLYTLPILGWPEHQIGIRMANRMAYNASGVKASVTCTTNASSITLTTVNPALVPITGVSFGTNKETYGGQNISYVQLAANQSLTILGPACQ
ncbi:MAG: hypothetical protein U0350_10025 [Caldilineaceae bacterium]